MRPLAPGEMPMTWMEQLHAAASEFRPLKHRKFVDKLAGDASTLAALLPLTHDARVGADSDPAAFAAFAAAASEIAAAAADAAAKAAAGGGGFDDAGRASAASSPPLLAFDHHAFHTSVVPRGSKRGAAGGTARPLR